MSMLCVSLDNKITCLFFLSCKVLREEKTWHCVFYSHGILLSKTGELILVLVSLLPFLASQSELQTNPVHLSHLLFDRFLFDFMQNISTGCLQLSFHPFLYLPLFRARFRLLFISKLPPARGFCKPRVTVRADWYYFALGSVSSGNVQPRPLELSWVMLGYSCWFQVAYCATFPTITLSERKRRS